MNQRFLSAFSFLFLFLIPNCSSDLPPVSMSPMIHLNDDILLSAALSSSLSESRRLDLLSTYLKHSVWRVELAMSFMNKARSTSSLGANEDADLTDCQEMLDSAKDRMLSSQKELQGGKPNLKSYANVHTWLSTVLTRYRTCTNGVTSVVSKLLIQSHLEELISRARVALAIFVSVSPVRDVELKMVVPHDFPAWLTDLDKNLIDSSPEALKGKANIVVAKDGTGLAAAPENSKERYIIYVKKGVYEEIVNIGKRKVNITIVGDGRDSTLLTGSLSGVDGDGFMAQDIGIQNTAGPEKGQAVALRISADMSVVYRCGVDAFQDTLYAHSGRQFYRECYITGTVDFICGNAAAVFQFCQIEARKPLVGQSNMITAQSREDKSQNSGFSIHKCNVTATSDLTPLKGTVKTYLGRPWGVLSRVVFMESFLDDLIDPAGWFPWNDDKARLSTLFYGEYENKGPGADTKNRVNWKGFNIITDPNEAANFTVGKLLYGDEWLNSTGVPYEEGV
ncbi:hypothetical protein N665_2557s0005 [Sinapis alba]|nr:hypothetical protein N665_2557s0005 [Sinapis alba]